MDPSNRKDKAETYSFSDVHIDQGKVLEGGGEG